MADNLSNYLENKLLDHSFGKTSFTMPTTVAAALFTSTATAAEIEAGTLTNEVANSGAYARVTVPGASFAAASGGSITTSADITFPTATGAWGTVRFVAFLDSTTLGAGNVLWYGQLAADKTIASGDVFKILAGQLTATLA
jgi:hypothetical protein